MYKVSGYLKQSKVTTVDQFIKTLQPKLKSIFPKSQVIVRENKNFGTDIEVYFTVGKEKSEFAHNIEFNDPLRMVFMIGYKQIDKEGNLNPSITAELASGGHMKLDNSVNLGYRKKTGSPEQVIDHIVKFFKKVRTIFDKHKSEMPDYLQKK